MKKLLSLLLVLAMLLSLVACGSKAETPEEPEDNGTAVPEVETPAPAFPVTITDASGNEVTIESEPQKLVSGYYISTSMLIALGVEDRMVGIEAKAASRGIYNLAAPELIELPSVGTAKEFDLEGCAALEPDLVILPLKLQGVVPTLNDLGITAITVNPESLDDLRATVEMLGKATGATERADKLLAYYDSTIADLETVLDGAEATPVYLAGNDNYLRTAGAAMYQNTLLTLGGGKNVAEELTDDYWVDIDYEQLLTWNPAVIIIAPDAEYTADDIMNDANLAELDAVKNGMICAMPSDIEAWDSPVPGTLLGSHWIAMILHPDCYPADNYAAEVDYFYSNFYDVNFDK